MPGLYFDDLPTNAYGELTPQALQQMIDFKKNCITNAPKRSPVMSRSAGVAAPEATQARLPSLPPPSRCLDLFARRANQLKK